MCDPQWAQIGHQGHISVFDCSETPTTIGNGILLLTIFSLNTKIIYLWN